MKTKFITGLQKVIISADLGKGDRFRDNLYITNNKEFVNQFLSDTERTLIGDLNFAALMQCKTFVYLNSECEFENGEKEVVSIIRDVKALCLTSWFLIDNCMNCEDAFIFYNKDDRTYVHSNFVATIFSAADGDIHKEVEFTRDDLRSIRKLYNDYFSETESYSDIALTTFNENYNRVSRALLFLQVARTSIDLGIKVANYVGALEALFCGTTNEIAHQLSERIAVFNENDLGNRLAKYYLIKNAYNIRSSVVHGDIISKKRTAELKKVSIEIDEILRKSLKEIILNEEIEKIFSGTTEILNEFFLKKIFS